jgi:hypothetical protein
MADELAPVPTFDSALAELVAALQEANPAVTTADVVKVMQERPRSPVPDYLLQQQREGIPNAGDTNTAAWPGVLNALGDSAAFGAEVTGIPSIVRGVGNITDEGGDAWTKAKGAGQVAMGSIPGLAMSGRVGAPALNAIAGTMPRILGTTTAAAVPSVVVGARDDAAAADKALSGLQPPDYMTKELADLQAQKAAKQAEFNALNQKHAKSGPETQRQALDPLRTDLTNLNTKISEAEERIRTHMAGVTETARKELPFRQRYPGAAEAIGQGAAAASTFIPFASTLKNRLANAVEGLMMRRAANQAEVLYPNNIPAFAEAQAALGRRADRLDDATSGFAYNKLGAQPGALATQATLGSLLNFEGGSIPEQIDALAFPPGHPTREKARDEISNPDYWKSRAAPAIMWGIGTTGVGTKAAQLASPGGQVPESARNIIKRGSPESIQAIERIARYRQAEQAALNGGRLVDDAQRLEAAASVPALPAPRGTSDQPSQSVGPVIDVPSRQSLVDRMAGGRNALGDPQSQRQLPAPEAAANQAQKYSLDELPIRDRVTRADGKKVIVHRNPPGQGGGQFASDPRKKLDE